MHALPLAATLLMLSATAAAAPSPPAENEALSTTIAALDTAVFDAFNRCADPAQLARHAGYFAEDVEFYHDTGGVTWTREAMIDNTRRHACGHYTRALVPGSLRIYPIQGFGAISQGTHRFCQTDAGGCEGEADFTMVWRQRDGQWTITRVLSYGHRPNPDPS